MRKGLYEDGEKVLRAKISMSSKNLNLRDPIMYRILKVNHHRTGNNGQFIQCMIGHMD